MLLYITGDTYSSIFDKHCGEKNIDIKKEYTQDLAYYFNKNLNNLSHINIIAIDLKHIVNDDDEIINSIVAFRTVNSKVKIIIVAIGRDKGDIFLGKLFKESIFDFVTSENEIFREEEIFRIINNENTYSSALGFRVENVESIKTSKPKKSFELSKFKFNKFKKSKKDLKVEENNEVEEDTIIEEVANEVEENAIVEEVNEVEQDVITEEQSNEVYIKEVISDDENVNLQNLIEDIVGNNNFLSEQKFNRLEEKIKLEFINNETALFFYYYKPIGIYLKSENNCVLDSLFDKKDIKDHLDGEKINISFKQDICLKIKKIKY